MATKWKKIGESINSLQMATDVTGKKVPTVHTGFIKLDSDTAIAIVISRAKDAPNKEPNRRWAKISLFKATAL